jgi:periplasmic protein TonB
MAKMKKPVVPSQLAAKAGGGRARAAGSGPAPAQRPSPAASVAAASANGTSTRVGSAPERPPAATSAATPRGAGAWSLAWFGKLSTLQIALLVSVAVHAGLLTIRFVDPDRFNRMFADTPLEVILVNSRSGLVPDKAQAIAQANLAGGGEALKGRATSPLPPSALMEIGDANEDKRRSIEKLQQAQQQLLAQLRRELALLPPPDPARENGTPQERAQEEHRRQLVQLLAEIEKRINEENARPKKRYISPATREEKYALYYDALRRKIEERGTQNFPEYQGRKLYGELTMNVTVDGLGRVVDTDVLRPSNSAVLDRRAVAIVRAAAPFGPFTPEMRREADQLVITSRFRFTRDEALETTVVAPASR